MTDYWDRPLLDDFVAPAGRSIRDIAAYFGLVVPDDPVPGTYLQACDRLHRACAELRNVAEAYYDAALVLYGEWTMPELAVRAWLATPGWTELRHAIRVYERARTNYNLSRQVEARRAG